MNCPKCKSPDVTGHEIPGAYDGVAYWACNCGHKWHRFDRNDPARARLLYLCPSLDLAEKPAKT